MHALRLAAAWLALDEQPSEDLPPIATDALLRGIDSPSLREAAGASPRDVRVARARFELPLAELAQFADEIVRRAEELLHRCSAGKVVDRETRRTGPSSEIAGSSTCNGSTPNC